MILQRVDQKFWSIFAFQIQIYYYNENINNVYTHM